jgi:recombination associated protein RdgC
MPILRGSVTFARFKVEGLDKKDPHWIAKNLKARAFEPIRKSGEDERAQGFVELEDRDAAEFSAGKLHYGEWALFAYRVDTLKVPGGLLRDELEKWLKTYEAEHAKPASRREKNDARAALKQKLRQKLEPRSKTFDVSWSVKRGELQVWAGSRKAVEEVQTALEKALDVQLTALAPATAAASLGVAEEALTPTPELSWPDFKDEVRA